MRDEITLFDFDGTLTMRDTVSGFFFHCGRKKRGFPLRVIAYLAIQLLVRIRMVSLDSLKKAGVSLFLRGMAKDDYLTNTREYGRSIKMSPVFCDAFANAKRKIVVSASFREYVAEAVQGAPVVASELAWENDRVTGMKYHCFGLAKVAMLTDVLAREVIGAVYTDSVSDRPLIGIAREVHWVQGGLVVRSEKGARREQSSETL